ncbi:MAG: hypothetical protein M3R24_14320 [Chloroflexota bacterium]|nr:hypothetical protein [Chloroflexota bacterium]
MTDTPITVRVIDLDEVAATDPITLLQLCQLERLPTIADDDTLSEAKLCTFTPPDELDGWWELTIPAPAAARRNTRGKQQRAPLRYRVRPGQVEYDTGLCWGLIEEAQALQTAPAAYYLMRALEHALIRDLAYSVLGRYDGDWRDVIVRAMPLVNKH